MLTKRDRIKREVKDDSTVWVLAIGTMRLPLNERGNQQDMEFSGKDEELSLERDKFETPIRYLSGNNDKLTDIHVCS